jgi:hypothetical protein
VDLQRHLSKKKQCQVKSTSTSTINNIGTDGQMEEIRNAISEIQLQLKERPTTVNATINIMNTFCMFGNEDMSHIKGDDLMKSLKSNTPNDALQELVKLIYYPGDTMENTTFFIDNNGDSWARTGTIPFLNSQIPKYTPVDKYALVRDVCFKDVNIMDYAFNGESNKEVKGRKDLIITDAITKALTDVELGQLDDFVSDATNIIHSSATLRQVDNPFEKQIMQETHDNIIRQQDRLKVSMMFTSAR